MTSDTPNPPPMPPEHPEQAQRRKFKLKETAKSYTCPICGRVSHNPNYVVHQYCGNCHV